MKKFPQFIGIDDTDEVKLILLSESKKLAKINGNNYKLLPYTFDNVLTGNDIRNVYDSNILKIKYRKKLLFTIYIVEDENKGASYLKLNYRMPMSLYYWNGQNIKVHKNDDIFMTKDEITNLKRTILMDNMLKK